MLWRILRAFVGPRCAMRVPGSGVARRCAARDDGGCCARLLSTDVTGETGERRACSAVESGGVCMLAFGTQHPQYSVGA